MKNKTKKIIASVGVGLVLGCGSIMATGCSDLELTQTQVDRIFEVVDNSDKFMKDYMEMQGENNNKLTREVAFGLYKTAIGRIQTNVDYVWDNLTIKCEMSDRNIREDNYTITLYRSAENEQCLQIKDETGIVKEFYLQYGDGATCKYFEEETTLLQDTKIVGLINSNVLAQVLNCSFDVEETDIVGYETLEDGNIQITTVKRYENENGSHIADVFVQNIVSPEAKLVSRTIYDMEGELLYNFINLRIKYTFEYGNVDVDAVNTIIDIIKGDVAQN